MPTIPECKAQIRRLKGLLNSGCLKDFEVLAKQELLRQWSLALAKATTEATCRSVK